MKWADADASPDLEHGWPGADSVTSLPADFNSAQFDKDLKNVLMEKAEGTIHTKVENGEDRGECISIRIYTNGSLKRRAWDFAPKR